MDISGIIEQCGEEWDILRDGNAVCTASGFRDSSRHLVTFLPNTDVRAGDVVTSMKGGQTYRISRTDALTYDGEVFRIDAYYEVV